MRLIPLATLALFGLILTGCDYLPTPENTAKKSVRESLIDPDSAKFSDVFKGVEGGDYCGLVNAKNRMGAYSGKSAFIYDEITEGFGLSYLMSEPLVDRDFERLINGGQSYFSDNYKKIQEGCGFTDKWAKVCGKRTPFPEHRLCASFASDSFIKDLYKEFKD